jgi:hypothetical protein
VHVNDYFGAKEQTAHETCWIKMRNSCISGGWVPLNVNLCRKKKKKNRNKKIGPRIHFCTQRG